MTSSPKPLRERIKSGKMSIPAPRGWSGKIDRAYDSGWNDSTDVYLPEVEALEAALHASEKAFESVMRKVRDNLYDLRNSQKELPTPQKVRAISENEWFLEVIEDAVASQVVVFKTEAQKEES